MANTSVPLNVDAVEHLINEGTRLIEVTQPIWHEVGKLAAKIPRRYLPIVAGLAAVGLLGVVAATSRRRQTRVGPRRSNVVEMKPEAKPIDVEAV